MMSYIITILLITINVAVIANAYNIYKLRKFLQADTRYLAQDGE